MKQEKVRVKMTLVPSGSNITGPVVFENRHQLVYLKGGSSVYHHIYFLCGIPVRLISQRKLKQMIKGFGFNISKRGGYHSQLDLLVFQSRYNNNMIDNYLQWQYRQ